MAGEERKTNEQKLYDDYREVFTSEAGKRVLRHLMGECHFFGPLLPTKDPFSPSTINAMLHAEGARNVVLHILEMLKLDEYYREHPEALREQERLSMTDYRSPLEEDK